VNAPRSSSHHGVTRGFFIFWRKAFVNVTVETLAPCRRLVRVEVDASTVDAALDKTTADFQREARFPGFRPGKAPRDLVTRTYGKQIEDEAKKRLISDHYRKAMEEQKLRAVGSPDIEEIQFGRGQILQFAATIEIVPDFSLPEYKGIPIKRDLRAVTDEDMQRALDVLREQHASYKDVTRPVQTGDFVVVNYSGTTEGKPLTELAPTARGLTQQSNFWLHIEPGSFIPGFTEQLVGAQKGEHRTVNVDFPADFVAPQLSGKKGTYEVDIVQVKAKILPELNDEFAKAFGAEGLEKLKAGVRRDLENELEFKKKRTLRSQLVRSILERVQFDLPESVVLNETKSVIYDILRENEQRGISKATIDQQKDEIYNAAANNAKDRVKASFVLGQIAEKEGIKVSQQELTGRIVYLAEQNHIKPEKFVKQLKERNAIGQIHEQILSSKVLDFLETNARIEG
jgi:trigger factor